MSANRSGQLNSLLSFIEKVNEEGGKNVDCREKICTLLETLAKTLQSRRVAIYQPDKLVEVSENNAKVYSWEIPGVPPLPGSMSLFHSSPIESSALLLSDIPKNNKFVLFSAPQHPVSLALENLLVYSIGTSKQIWGILVLESTTPFIDHDQTDTSFLKSILGIFSLALSKQTSFNATDSKDVPSDNADSRVTTDLPLLDTPIEKEQSPQDPQTLTSALVHLAIALNSTLDLDEVLDRVLETLTTVVPNKTSNVMLMEGNQIRMVRSKGYDEIGTEEMVMARTFEVDKVENFKTMCESKQPVLTADTANNKSWRRLPESYWIRSHVGAPILVEGEVIGFINCDSDVPSFYNETHMHTLVLFAAQTGLAIRNAKLFDATTRNATKLRLINDLTHQVLEAKTLAGIIEILPEKLIALFDATNVYISRWNEDTQTATGWTSSCINKKAYVNNFSLPGEKSLTQHVINMKHAVLIKDISESKLMEAKFVPLYSEKTILGLPLLSENTKLGAILLGYQDVNQVTEEIISMAEYAALQISSAIGKANSLDLERNQTGQLAHANTLIETLSRAAAAVKSGGDTKTVMETIGNELELLAIHSLVMMRTSPTEKISMIYSSLQSKIVPFLEKVVGLKIQELPTSMESIPILKNIIEEQKPLFVDDPSTILAGIVPSYLSPVLWKLLDTLAIQKTTRAIFAPLVAGKNSIGLLILWGTGLQKVDLQAATILGEQMAIALENATLLEKIQRLALTDELTEVYNRRGFQELSEREFAITHQFGRNMSMIMLDIDHFKQVNDAYGHPVGDEVLVALAVKCKNTIREIDILGRYGGEEFLILLIENDLKTALLVAERVRKNVAETKFLTSAGEVTITISLGVASLDGKTRSVSDLIQKADLALYVSKENGRNRVSSLDGKSGG
jgi:diguanylate cyclase (GGDEF)-like protein